MTWDRVMLLCEDRAHLEFLEGVCEACGWSVVGDPEVQPKGKGAASGWVIKRLPDRLRELRSGAYPGLGLLVAVDGDNRGRVNRLGAIRLECERQGVSVLDPSDAVALLVPTWSIETWALFFCKGVVVPENRQSKLKAVRLFRKAPKGLVPDDVPRGWKPDHLERLLTGFLGVDSHPELPSIDASRAEIARWRPGFSAP